MSDINELFSNNKAWTEVINAEDPEFFKKLTAQQTPEYLWIGCADSRVPANEIVGLLPGELFVHRNVANSVIHTDLNCLSVIQYAVDVLKVKHVIVCGHYGCGGVQAAMQNQSFGIVDYWLRHLKDLYQKHHDDLKKIPDQEQRWERMCELNVIEQVYNVCHTNIVQDAWDRGQPLSIHGWIYNIKDGLLHDLKARFDSKEEISKLYRLTD